MDNNIVIALIGLAITIISSAIILFGKISKLEGRLDTLEGRGGLHEQVDKIQNESIQKLQQREKNQLTSLEPWHGLKSLEKLGCQWNPSLSEQKIERFKEAVPSCPVNY